MSGFIVSGVSGGAGASQFDADSGSAVPVASVLNIVGGTNVTTSGAGNTITINASADLDIAYISTTDATYTVLATDQFVSVDASGGAKQVNLPNTTTTGRVIRIKDQGGDAAGNNITVTTPGGAVTIDGSTTLVMNSAYESISVIWNSSSYEIF